MATHQSPSTTAGRPPATRQAVRTRATAPAADTPPAPPPPTPSAHWPTRAARAAAFPTHPVPELPSPAPAPLLSGALPPWLRGAFLRNGPGVFPAVQNHLFDGYAALTRLELDGGAGPASPPATQTQRFIQTAAWTGFQARGKPTAAEFGTPLPFWAGLASAIKATVWPRSDGFTDNASVTVRRRPGTGQVVAMTESVAGTYALDAVTLATEPGRVRYAPDDGVRGQLTTAHVHARSDGSLVAFASGVGAGWTVYTQDPTSLARCPVASFPARPGSKGGGPAWVHDPPASDRLFCLPEGGCTLDVKAALLGGGEHVMFAWDGRAGTRFTLVGLPPVRSDGDGGGGGGGGDGRAPALPPGGTRVVECPAPLFYFHVINAFEDGGSFTFDVPAFPDPSMVNALGLGALRAGPGEAAARPVQGCEVVRVSLPLAGPPAASITTLVPATAGGAPFFFEFPTMNPAWKGRADYRFTYGVGSPAGGGVAAASLGTAISKLDVRAGRIAAQWAGEPGGIPGEPLFVGRPGAVDEDDGVVLAHVTAASGASVVVVLDAKDLSEVARVGLAAPVAYGFHGCWLPEES